MHTRVIATLAVLGVTLSVAPASAVVQEPDEAAMMAAYQEAATPGEEHERLARLAGKYSLHVKFWPAPGAPAVESPASSELKMVLGGRYLIEEWSGTYMGQPMSGIGTYGYDNVEQQYVASWMDTMGTGIFKMSGAFDPALQAIVQTGTYMDPLTKQTKTMKSVLKVAGDDGFVHEMYDVAADGSEVKMMEITYSKMGT